MSTEKQSDNLNKDITNIFVKRIENKTLDEMYKYLEVHYTQKYSEKKNFFDYNKLTTEIFFNSKECDYKYNSQWGYKGTYYERDFNKEAIKNASEKKCKEFGEFLKATNKKFAERKFELTSSGITNLVTKTKHYHALGDAFECVFEVK